MSSQPAHDPLPAQAPGNAEVARALHELALRLEMEGVSFKPKAYARAARAIEEHDEPIAALHARAGSAGLSSIRGIGPGIAARLEELLRGGRIAELERLRAKAPADVLGLARVPGLGARKIRAVHEKLGVTSLAELESACRAGRLAPLRTFGARGEGQILRALAALKESGQRRLLSHVQPFAAALQASLARIDGVEAVAIAGAVRRCAETVTELAWVMSAAQPARALAAAAALPQVAEVCAQDPSGLRVRLANGLEAAIGAVIPGAFGAAQIHFTGSAAHVQRLRLLAAEGGCELRTDGLFRGARRLPSSGEAEVYAALGLPFIEPELREDRGEIEAGRAGTLPCLIAAGALRGDLQVQTDWTDGSASIADMAAAARAAGFAYIAITDHTRDLAMARGLDEDRLLEQMQAIAELNAGLDGFRVLSGAEVNIRADGTLDIADEVLARLDVVGAAVHSHLQQPAAEMTARLIRAIENPHVDVLFHPTERRIGHREPVDLDLDALIAAAVRTGTALEIDAQPDRLDLRDEHVRRALAAGAKLVIDSDAHHPSHLMFPERFGVPLARRGWATAADVLNTRTVDDCLAALKDRARPR